MENGMKRLLIGLCLTTACWGQEVGIPKVYKGDEGLEVTVLRYGPRENNQALVWIRGVDTKWNDKVFLTKHEETDRASDYVIDGKYHVVVGRKHWGNSWRYEAYPGDRKEYDIRYNEELSKAVRPEDVVEKYRQNPGKLDG
jgi:hypothetical protein